MDDSAYFVKSTSPGAFIISVKYFACVLQTYCRCACESLMMKKYSLINLHYFNLANFRIIVMHKLFQLFSISVNKAGQWLCTGLDKQKFSA